MMRRKSKKTLSQEDRVLWQQVIKDADPLVVAPLVIAPVILAQIPKTPPLPQPAKIAPFRIGGKTLKPATRLNLMPDLDEIFAKSSPNMDGRNFTRLKKGKLPVDGTIDLHGMTIAMAHPALTRFVSRAHGDGKRLLLVITGKGKTSQTHDFMTERRGVLKHQVPQWLCMAPMAAMVLQVTQAHAKHGGSGAYYVYLRRQR